jgi:ABC-type nitrate/sulfonate/bicarbonate transport system ATPase subunit
MQEIFPIIAKRRDAYAGHLSGGEQQMVALGRSMISHPRVLLLDEPSAGLSPIATASVYQSIARYAREAQVTILLVEQNVRWALELAQRGASCSIWARSSLPARATRCAAKTGWRSSTSEWNDVHGRRKHRESAT